MSDYRIGDTGRILPGGMDNEIHRLPMRLAGIALLIMAAVGWISLASWSIGDPNLNRATGGVPGNFLGETGASLADMLFQVLGLTAIALFLPPAAWGLSLLSGESIVNPRHRLAMWTLSLIFIASALSMIPKPDRWLLVHGLGGVVGDFGKSFFLTIGGSLNERIAVAAGGLIAAFLGLWTLMRASGIGRREIAMMMYWKSSSGRGLLGHFGTALGRALSGVFQLRVHIVNALARDAAPGRHDMSPYWQPDDPDRFAHVPRTQGSFNPRFGGYDPETQEQAFPQPRVRRPLVVQMPQAPAPQAGPHRIEPYFDNHRAIPWHQQHPSHQAPTHNYPAAHYPQPAQPAPQPQLYAPQHQMPPAPSYYQPQPHPQPPASAAPRHQAVTPYANENYEAAPFGEDDYEEQAYYQESQPSYQEPQSPPLPIVRGQRLGLIQQNLPDRSAKPDIQGRVAESRNWEVGDFMLPPLNLLTPPPPRQNDPELSDAALGRRAEMLQSVLEDFRIKGQITGVHPGPVITLYEFEPARGTKSSRVVGLADDIARSMSAISARVAVIPGRDAIGIELPNQNREVVYLRQLLESKDFSEGKGRLQLALGKTIGGDPVIVDLARMPHLLIAGTTGSGKSVAINTMILSLLYRLPPEECRFIMIDPKMLELSVYDGIPHLLTPVVTDPHQAIKALKWTVSEMNARYERMCKLGVRNIMGFNQKVARAKRTGEPLARTVQTGFDEETGSAIYEREPIDPTPMPYIVVVIDEMADLMMVAGKDIEFAVQRLSQMARAAGIHLIMATQRPSVDVITGTIKANFPSRISFQVTSKIDSRTILGEQGAEQLLGAGDMLTMAAGGRIMRAHGPFVSDDEVENIVNVLREQGEPDYIYGVLEDEDNGNDDDNYDGDPSSRPSSNGDVYEQAIQIVLRDKRPTTSYLQRRLGIGYNRAASLIERMEADGIISAPNRTGKREVLAGEQS
jgi:S-DNA-T family DNA segregation ATPase FtsK/SpoIIIE